MFTMYMKVLEDLERFVGWPMFCWRHDRGLVTGILERVEWLYVRRWEQSVFALIHQRVLERLGNLINRLIKGIDGFIVGSFSGRVCGGVVSLGEALVDWRMNVVVDCAVIERGRMGNIRVMEIEGGFMDL